jgi:predicted acetylornithine/succinylornithine family transaminase
MTRRFEEIQQQEDRYQLGTYKKFPLSIERGEGAYVYDLGGKRFLDLYGGHAVAITGHCHPRVVAAVKEQAEKLIFYSNVVYSSVRADASEALVGVAPRGMDKVFFCNSGAEANETAMKIARRFTGRNGIVAMKNGFHGRTMGALSATALDSYRKQFSPLLEGFAFADFGSIESLKEVLGPDVGGVILEPIQSMAGVEMAADEYYRELRRVCDERGAVLIFDEVQTGLGRTGSWFFGDALGVVPDLITMAKGLGGGVPVGGVLIHERISKTIGSGEHGSTFGGGPLACAAVKANIDAIKDEKLVENAARVGEYLRRRLERLPLVKGVKGRGLLVGIEIDGEAVRLRDHLLERGVITGTASRKNVLRLLPPLVLNEKDVDIFVKELEEFDAKGRKA